MDTYTLQGLGLIGLILLSMWLLWYLMIGRDLKRPRQAPRTPTRTIEVPAKLIINCYD